MSTLVVGQPETTASWKQEVSLRLAEHKSRRGWPAAKPAAAPTVNWMAAGSRAAEAAARVAARYAQAPSYSQILAEQSRAATPAISVVAAAPPRTAVQAQPVIEEWPAAANLPSLSILESAENASPTPSTVRDWEPAISSQSAMPASLEEWENECALHRQEPGLLLLRPAPVPCPIAAASATSVPAPASASILEEPIVVPVSALLPHTSEPDKWDWKEAVQNPPENGEIEPIEPDLPIPANLIEFPRELVAARKMRPRRAEGPFAVARPEMQLSIFEVDPSAISTQPDSSSAVLESWSEPGWAEIVLDPQAREEADLQPTMQHSLLHLAPLGHRLRAVLADGVLIGAMLAPVLMAAARVGHPNAAKIVELGVVSGLLIAGLLYQTLFLTLTGTTPGMRLAGISLCTFDGQIPTGEQLRSRLGGLTLSLVPVGLGIAWALFDDDRLCWHDRLSRTYPRKN
ncbi:MAG: RDD family protein [Terracidiphilus sp.]